MSASQASIGVRGTKPVPWGNNEWTWRKHIADEARKHRQVANFPQLSALRFDVKVTFYLRQSGFAEADLDNLVKPVLDTIFLPSYPQVKDRSLTGAIFEIDDCRIFKLTLEKRLAVDMQEEGADIIVSWGV